MNAEFAQSYMAQARSSGRCSPTRSKKNLTIVGTGGTLSSIAATCTRAESARKRAFVSSFLELTSPENPRRPV